MTPKQWIERTGAVGIVSRAGRYGGTFAHKDHFVDRLQQSRTKFTMNRVVGLWASRVMGSGMQFDTQSVDNLENSIKTRGAFTGKSLVETLARKACVSCHLRHAFGPGNITESFGDKGRITIRFLNASFQISRHLIRAPEMFGNVIFCGCRFAHLFILTSCVQVAKQY